MTKIKLKVKFPYNTNEDFDFHWVIYNNGYFLECNHTAINISETTLIPEDKKAAVTEEGRKTFKDINGYDLFGSSSNETS